MKKIWENVKILKEMNLERSTEESLLFFRLPWGFKKGSEHTFTKVRLYSNDTCKTGQRKMERRVDTNIKRFI